MEVLDAIYSRRSVRKYRDIPVDVEMAAKVADAGMRAPSSGNIQNWRFVYVANKDKKALMAKACNDQHWMNGAPVHLVICSDVSKAIKYYGARGEHRYSSQNAAACIQNMLLAAHHYGLGACWVGSFDEAEIKNILGIPDGFRVEAVMTLGYSAETPAEPSRFKLFDYFFVEAWETRNKDGTWSTRDYAWSVEKRLKGRSADMGAKSSDLLSKGKELFSKVGKKKEKPSK